MIENTKKVVENFINALNEENFKEARSYVLDDMKFIGVLGSRDGIDAYFNDMEKMRFKYDIKKICAENNDVCVFYDIDMNGLIIFSCGWYRIKNEKIKSIRVLFDPRPVLEAAKKK